MAELLKNIINLMRPLQWYKNILIFLPLFFSGLLFDPLPFVLTIAGFFLLCTLSSANYIINDIIDRKKDRKNPEKKNRPIAAGKLSTLAASILALFLAIISLSLAFLLSFEFFLILLIFFLLTQSYSIFLKEEAIIDVILISINFVLRAVSGALLIDVEISRWLIVGTFALALFLAISKRYSELKMLGENASKHRKVYRFYTQEMLKAMLIITTGILFISYIMFSLFSEHEGLFYSLPVVVYPIFRFYYLIETNSTIPRNLERVYNDKKLTAAILITGIVIFAILYLEHFF